MQLKKQLKNLTKMETKQTTIDVQIEIPSGSNYAAEKAKFEQDKKNKEFFPVFLAYLPKTKSFSAFRLTSRSLIESFNFQIIES